MKDFFISYNQEDKHWAEWIAWQLEEAGYSVVFQAWDFVGNWLIKMDQAMRETARTIAVLSPNYIKGLYTHSEWANAFRLDPIGERDLLIPVRVQPVHLDGVLAQIVYVDLVNSNEAAAIELLLKRVRGERGKPAVRPIFPSSGMEPADLHRVVVGKPPYPAFDEDTKRLIRARELLVDWRSRYSGQGETIRIAGEKARAWSRTVPTQLNDDVAFVLELGGRVARDLQTFPVSELEFATAYGLMVHRTVFGGAAMRSVVSTHELYEDGIKMGLPLTTLADKSSFEMVARVLESAYALACLNLNLLPRGFIETGSLSAEELGSYHTLLAARINDDPRLHLLAADGQPKKLVTFAARKLPVYPLCGRRNNDGTVDLVANDGQYVYWWSKSSPHPVMQYAMDRHILCASFVTSESQLTVVTVESGGKIRQLKLDGRMDIVVKNSGNLDFASATLWIDPLQPEQWCVLAQTPKRDLVSLSLKGTKERSATTMWGESSIRTGTNDQIRWQDNSGVAISELNGLSCLVASRQAHGGEGVHFLDPASLVDVREPLFIPGSVADTIVAGGRWLVVVFFQEHDKILPRLAVWDLHSTTQDPIARFFERNGDVRHAIVVSQAEGTFEMMFVLHSFIPGAKRRLCLFSWPTGRVEELDEYSDLRMIRIDHG